MSDFDGTEVLKFIELCGRVCYKSREWRHFLKLRTDKVAHPQMRQVAFMILHILKEKLPVIFKDIGE